MDRRSRFYSQTVEGGLRDRLYMVGITVNASDGDHQVEHLADVEVAAKLTRPLRLSEQGLCRGTEFSAVGGEQRIVHAPDWMISSVATALRAKAKSKKRASQTAKDSPGCIRGLVWRLRRVRRPRR